MNLMTLDFASAQDSHDGCDDASHNHAAHDNTAHQHAPAAKPAVPEPVQEAIRTLLLLVAPMMPHLAEEANAWFFKGLDAVFGQNMMAQAAWPAVDPALLVDDEVTVAVQVKGKLRDTLTVAKGTAREELEALALASDKVQRALDGAAVKKVIVVPDRLVNLVV